MSALVRVSELADTEKLTFKELLASNDTVLANSVRNLLADIDRSAEAISGWSSYVDLLPQVLQEDGGSPEGQA